MPRHSRILLVIMFSVAGAGAPANAPLAISFSVAGVNVTGATPNAPILIFSVANEPTGYSNILTRTESIVTTDASGTAQVSVAPHLPRRSIWFAVNARSGEFAVAAPPGFPLLQTFPVPSVLTRDKDTDLIALDTDFADMVVLRPGAGAWVDSLAKGGSKDNNKTSGLLHAQPRTFRSIDKASPPPEHVTPADVVIVVDPHTLRYYIGRPAAR